MFSKKSLSINSWQLAHWPLPKQVNPFPNKPWFVCACSTSLLKTLWEKENLLIMSISLFPQCFLLVWKLFIHFYQIWNCRLLTLSVWISLKFITGASSEPQALDIQVMTDWYDVQCCFSTLFHLYLGSQFTYPCFPGISISELHTTFL